VDDGLRKALIELLIDLEDSEDSTAYDRDNPDTVWFMGNTSPENMNKLRAAVGLLPVTGGR